MLELYTKAVEDLRPLFDGMNRTRTNIALVGYMGDNKARNVINSIYLDASSAKNGLAIMFFMDRVKEYFKLPSDQLQAVLGPPAKDGPTYNPNYNPNTTFYFDEQHQNHLIGLLAEAKQRR